MEKEYNHEKHSKRVEDEDGVIYCEQCEEINQMTDEEYKKYDQFYRKLQN